MEKMERRGERIGPAPRRNRSANLEGAALTEGDAEGAKSRARAGAKSKERETEEYCNSKGPWSGGG